MKKPDACIYEEVARRFQVDTSECMFVGDGGSNELAGAKAVGMKAIQAKWYTNQHPRKRGNIAGVILAEEPGDVVKYVEQWKIYEVVHERLSESENKLQHSHRVRTNGDSIVVMVSNTYDVFFNFTHMKPEWKIGNLKTDNPDELVRRIIEEDFPALNLARQVTMQELVARYGNAQSEKAFSLSDYKDYLLNKYLEDCYAVEYTN